MCPSSSALLAQPRGMTNADKAQAADQLLQYFKEKNLNPYISFTAVYVVY